jgi:hypothetical protein
MIIIQPASWLALLRENKTKEKYDLIKNKIQKYVKSVEIQFSKYFGFDIGLYGPMSLTYINKEQNFNNIEFKYLHEPTKYVSSLNDVNLIGDYTIIKSIEKCIKDKEKYTINDFINKPYKKYFVNLSSIGGNGALSVEYYDNIIRKFGNKFNLINSTSNKVTNFPMFSKPQKGKEIGNSKNYITFEIKEEAENFLKFITKTKLVKYLLLTYNIDQNLNSAYEYIPFLDFSSEWTDEKINSRFNFSEEQIEFINNIVNRNSDYGYGYYDN